MFIRARQPSACPDCGHISTSQHRAWATFQVMRRTHASLMHELEVDPKTVADQLGHTLDVNQNVYTKSALRHRQKAINLLETVLQTG